MNSFICKLAIFAMLICSLYSSCHVGEFSYSSTCKLCQRKTPYCTNCNQTTGNCITCRGNIPAWIDSTSKTYTCLCPANQMLGYNMSSGTIACQSKALGNEIYNNNTAQIQAMTNNLTLSNLQLISAIIWSNTDSTILQKMVNILNNGSAILAGSISQGGNPQNTEQAIIALLGLAFNPTQNFSLLQGGASLMRSLISSGTSNIKGIDYALEFYSLAQTTVSSTDFSYEYYTTTEQKTFLQMLQESNNQIIPSLLSNIYFILSSGSPYMSSYSNSESSIIKLNKNASLYGQQTYGLFENSEYSLTIYDSALSLLPSGDVYLYLNVQYANPLASFPNITFDIASKILTVIFFDENFTQINSQLRGLSSSQFMLQLTANTASAVKLISWETDLQDWYLDPNSQQCTSYLASVQCSPQALVSTTYSLVATSSLITSCNIGEVLSTASNKCLLCNDFIPGCLQCSGYQCDFCQGFVPGSTFNQGQCQCNNNQTLFYNASSLSYICTAQNVSALYNSSFISSLTGTLTQNQLIQLTQSLFEVSSDIISLENIVSIFYVGIDYTNIYMREYYIKFCIATLLQSASSKKIVYTLMSITNLLKSMDDITQVELLMIGEFYGLALGQVNSPNFNFSAATALQWKHFLNQLHININNFKIALAQTNQNATYHFTNIYMGVTRVLATNNSFSTSLKANNYGISLNQQAIAKLPTSTNNYLVHMVLDQFALEMYSIGSPYSVLFLDSSFKNMNSALTNLSRSLQIQFVDYYYNQNQTLMSWNEQKLAWELNQAACTQTKSINMIPQIGCFPNSLFAAQEFVIQQN